MKELTCANCGTPIYLRDETYQRRVEDGQPFYCPNGHPNEFRESEVKKLKKQVERLSSRVDWLVKENNRMFHVVNGYKGQAAKLKRKVKALEAMHEQATDLDAVLRGIGFELYRETDGRIGLKGHGTIYLPLPADS